MAVLEALFQAERAAHNAANASGVLQQAVQAAQLSGAFDDVDSDIIGDSDTLPTVITSPYDYNDVEEDETPPLERAMDEDSLEGVDKT